MDQSFYATDSLFTSPFDGHLSRQNLPPYNNAPMATANIPNQDGPAMASQTPAPSSSGKKRKSAAGRQLIRWDCKPSCLSRMFRSVTDMPQSRKTSISC